MTDVEATNLGIDGEENGHLKKGEVFVRLMNWYQMGVNAVQGLSSVLLHIFISAQMNSV